MSAPKLSVREFELRDIERVVRYWTSASPGFLIGMGVDLAKVSSADALTQMLRLQVGLPNPDKTAYCVIWELDGEPVGHSNTNPTVFGESALMHLHLWRAPTRRKGMGSRFVQLTLPLLFDNLELKNLYSEPYAKNLAPHKTLAKVGFELEKEYTTVPGSLNFEQPVKRWRMSRARFDALRA